MKVPTPRRRSPLCSTTGILIAYAGLLPVMRLAERCGLSRLVAEKVKLTGDQRCGVLGGRKVTSIVAVWPRRGQHRRPGVLRHGADANVSQACVPPPPWDIPARLHPRPRPSTPRRHRRFLANLAAHTPRLPERTRWRSSSRLHHKRSTAGQAGGGYARFKGIRHLVTLLATILHPRTRGRDSPRSGCAAESADVRGARHSARLGPPRRGGLHRHAPVAGGLDVLHRGVWSPPAAGRRPASRSPPG